MLATIILTINILKLLIMKPQVKQLLTQSGYSPVFMAIDKSIRDLKREQYTTTEIKETLKDFFGGDDKIDNYINSVL